MSLTPVTIIKSHALFPIPDTSHRITAILKPKNGKPWKTTSLSCAKIVQSPIRTESRASDIVEWSPQCCALSLGQITAIAGPSPVRPYRSSFNIIHFHECSVIILQFIFIISFNFISFIIRTQSFHPFINKHQS